jgi:glycosyltransferase involved in cell wall biosynthesis
MRILLVTAYWAPAWIEGGAPVASWNMARGLALAGATVRVVTTDAYLDRKARAPAERHEAGLRIRTVPILSAIGGRAHRFGIAPAIGPVLWRAARDADLCLMQGLWTLPVVLASTICRGRGLPYVLWANGTLERISLGEKARKKSLFMKLYARPLVRRARAVYFASELERQNSREALGATPALVCPHGFDEVERRPREGHRLRQALGLAPDSVLVGLAGRIHPRKGFGVILPALSRGPERIHLVSFGPDHEDHLRDVRRLAHDLDLGRRFHVLGHLEGDELQSAYASIDVLALPSFGESFGNVVVEALRQGTEVLVSDGVALARFVEEQRLGRVVRGNEPQAWSSMLRRWLDEAERFDRDRAVRLVAAAFGLEACGRRMLAGLSRLRGECPGTTSARAAS